MTAQPTLSLARENLSGLDLKAELRHAGDRRCFGAFDGDRDQRLTAISNGGFGAPKKPQGNRRPMARTAQA